MMQYVKGFCRFQNYNEILSKKKIGGNIICFIINKNSNNPIREFNLTFETYPIVHQSEIINGHVFHVCCGMKVRIEAVVLPIPARGIVITPSKHSQSLLQNGFSFAVTSFSLFTVCPSREL